MGQTALIVGERTPAARDLAAILGGEQIPVRMMAAAEVGSWFRGSPHAKGLVLVSAALPPHEVHAVCEVVKAHGGRAGEIVLFAEQGAVELEAHRATGTDCLLPPYAVDLLRRRLAQFDADTAQAVDTAAHLAEYERELQIGREIQAGFLPHAMPDPAGWELGVRFHPAREVAGDFYDAFELVKGRRLGFVIADVCDKGVGAALFMALIRSLLRNTAGHVGSVSVVGLDVQWQEVLPGSGGGPRPAATAAGVGALLNAVNSTHRYMIQNHLEQGYFATLFFGVLDPATGSVVYINCGHNPPVVRRRDGRQLTLDPTGPALGMLADSSFRLGWLNLEPGDVLHLYTDGVTEAKNVEDEFFTVDRMCQVLDEHGAEGAEHLLARLDDGVRAHIGPADQFDDITMMALSRNLEPTAALTGAPGAVTGTHDEENP
jgi:sigma-B regulation protein RsbU (phosphoserine phosphatase)